ncbi:hypothetical protein [Brachyspira sp.]|uniref:hypothetical protein n=1 Tax=Brachyspira sp. TaxID=1977261 RepID=UPI002631D2B2|nr:hypothetical protein [Brachyspira sp.]
MKYILISIFILIVSCTNKSNIQNNYILKNKEIEPNDTLEYSQYIDCNSSISGKFDNDIDIYQINPTNGFMMDFYISTYDNKANIYLDIFSSNKTVFNINTEDIKDYKGFIEFQDILLDDDDTYFVRLNSDRECQYSLKFIFKDDNLPSNEIEYNNTIDKANTINYPNELIYGYFIKNYLNVEEYIKPYITNSNLLDIDFYKLENSTDINSSISIKLKYPKDIDIILFDENYNYIKKGINELNTSFETNKKYYIALVCYGDKYLIERYTLHYEFH